MSTYDVVRQHTMSHVNVRHRMLTYDVVYDIKLEGELTQQGMEVPLALLGAAAQARCFPLLDVTDCFEHDESRRFAWAEGWEGGGEDT
jgi:hypothetical protein